MAAPETIRGGNFTPQRKSADISTTISLPLPEFFDLQMIATGLLIFVGVSLHATLDGGLQFVLIVVVKSRETERLQAPIHRVQHLGGAEHRSSGTYKHQLDD
jgi:hypothetical protein